MKASSILLVGATSAIAQAIARSYAEQGAALFLVGRDAARLQELAADLRARGAAEAHPYPLDLDNPEQHAAMLDQCWTTLGRVDIALVCHGTLPDQRACEDHPPEAIRALQTNGVHVIALLLEMAKRFEQQGSGTIAAFGSVAGDRGRPSNAIYGAAKGSLAIFLSGLRARMQKCGVHVLTIKPGFVDTPMTEGLELPRMLLTTPERVAADVRRAIRRRQSTLYTPWFWWWILLIIRTIPEPLFKRLSL
ncbi:MAG: SDR family oxidoreductase [Halorhodospira sp.]